MISCGLWDWGSVVSLLFALLDSLIGRVRICVLMRDLFCCC
jgi:hypothetical protein